ncbi:DUF397 domain-containing protein [Saccharopolyspora phatthalungensis]|uniref:DUF397 domain-containing protein n=1 Tax=Saccharopolyspora phatthalungensis TaxID=664693 RepID=A0A840QBD6_9PSEU|nr:DUF397 domain-containing protein [Saccharopolyspora phatthalungensis]MBB5157726.1 hypothetical protein [Saccharopolyspora phatthalungensis]
MNAETTWRKSSYSTSTSTCVELTSTLDQVRDSKDPNGPTLRVDVAGFVRAVRNGRFDR